MIKTIAKYYLMFPPIARKAINISFKGFMNYAGSDFYHGELENILLETHEMINNILPV